MSELAPRVQRIQRCARESDEGPRCAASARRSTSRAARRIDPGALRSVLAAPLCGAAGANASAGAPMAWVARVGDSGSVADRAARTCQALETLDAAHPQRSDVAVHHAVASARARRDTHPVAAVSPCAVSVFTKRPAPAWTRGAVRPGGGPSPQAVLRGHLGDPGCRWGCHGLGRTVCSTATDLAPRTAADRGVTEPGSTHSSAV